VLKQSTGSPRTLKPSTAASDGIRDSAIYHWQFLRKHIMHIA
jgi:hypothetical protein